MKRNKRIALFAGSFDPFTIGHYSIVARALPLFDKIVIGFGINPDKTPWLPLDLRLDSIRRLFADEKKVEVTSFEGLTVNFAIECGAQFLLRGVRSAADYEAERNLADINRHLSISLQPDEDPIETVILVALPDLSFVSSSMVRQLARFGGPYTHYIL